MNIRKLNYAVKGIGRNFDLVNWGGCGVVAAMLADVLRPEFPCMKITTCERWACDTKDLSEMRSRADNVYAMASWPLAFTHVWVEIWHKGKWFAVDAEGVKSLKAFCKRWGNSVNGSFTYDEVRCLSEDTTAWNSMFDRSQIPDMYRYILEEVKPLVH